MGHKIIGSLLVIFLLSTAASQAQKYDCNYGQSLPGASTSEACAYNQMYNYSNTDTLARILIKKILALISLPTNFAIEPCDGINTCRAFLYDDGIRYIFYDRKFIDKIVAHDQNDWMLLGILAHELGHHLCGHTLRKANNEQHRLDELQADEFSGAMLARMGATEQQSVMPLYSIPHPSCEEEAYNPYPCLEKRLAAVLRGFRSIQPQNVQSNFIAKEQIKAVKTTDANEFIKFSASAVDLSNLGIPVGNQGQDASAVGFSIAYAMEYEVRVKYNYTVRLSPRYIYNSIGGTQVSGAYIERGLDFVKSKGAIEESIWPYKSGDYNNKVEQTIADTTSNRYTIKSWSKITDVSLDAIKKLLNQKKPVIAKVGVPVDLMQDVSGQWFLSEKSSTDRYHISTCFVGYDDKAQLLKFKNAWGTDWGDKGYGYIRYADFKQLVVAAFDIDL
jgi:hypothetical protein